MTTLAHPASFLNSTDFDADFGDYAARPSAHLDEGLARNEVDPDELERLDHEQSIDCGDHAANDDAAMAEEMILAAFPDASTIITRKQVRQRCFGQSGFETQWTAYAEVGDKRAYEESASLDRAINAVLKILSA